MNHLEHIKGENCITINLTIGVSKIKWAGIYSDQIGWIVINDFGCSLLDYARDNEKLTIEWEKLS